MPRRPSRLALVSLAFVVATLGCSGDEAPEPPADAATGDEEEVDSPAPDGTEPSPTPTARECRHDTLSEDPVVELVGDDPVAIATELVSTTHRCADTVVVAADDGWSSALAVSVAVAEDAPLLLVEPASPEQGEAAVAALEPDQVLTVGTPPLQAPGATDVVAIGDDLGATDDPDADTTDGPDADTTDGPDADTTDDPDADPTDGPDADPTDDPDPDTTDDPDAGARDLDLALAVLDHLDVDRAFAVPHDDEVARAAAITREGGAVPILPVRTDAEDLGTLSAALPPALRLEVLSEDEDAAADLADRLVGVGVDAQVADGAWWDLPSGVDTVWLVDPVQASTAAATAATAAIRGDGLLPIHASDLWSGRERVDRIADAAPDRAVVVGDVTEQASWQVPTLLDGPRLPWGGLTLFEDERMVALYGTPSSTQLGVLGEQQDLDATVERAREVAEPYGADGRLVVPAFEIIVTIASAEAGDRGDYSRRLDPDSFRPWIDRAADEGFYVVLDLQPGRADFLSQAQEYEELLREPHVGLALDPEWRLEDDQVHLRQIGSVDAAEVQQVADWLAALVRDNQLPQKLLVLHQFRFSMLPDRDDIVAPPELAVVVHMDGQGPIGDKYDTYAAITAGAEDRWWWGWKNFYDEDLPTPTPAQVLELDPLPVFVSYQ